MIVKEHIPKHWKIKPLGNLCLTTSGGTPSRKEPSYYNGNIPWVKSGELSNGVVYETEEKITDEALKNSSAKIFPKGTLLIALYGATIGKMAFLGIDASTNQAVCGIFKSQEIESKFLYYFLFFSKPDLLKNSIGGAQPNISQGILKSLLIPVPPPSEQQQVVEKIEELFSDLDAGRRQLETVRQQLKTYRQAVLKWAFEGKLISRDGNLMQGAKEFNWYRLKDISEKITDGEHFRPKTEDFGIPFLSAKDIDNDGVSFEDPLYISDEVANKALDRCNPKRNDILIVSRGASVGRLCIVNTDRKFCLLGSVILIKLKKGINSQLIQYYLKSPLANKQLVELSGSTAQQAIYLRDIKTIMIPYCEEEFQRVIVDLIEDRLSVCDKLEDTIETCLQQSEALKQSILKQAFEGNLVKSPNNCQ